MGLGRCVVWRLEEDGFGMVVDLFTSEACMDEVNVIW